MSLNRDCTVVMWCNVYTNIFYQNHCLTVVPKSQGDIQSILDTYLKNFTSIAVESEKARERVHSDAFFRSRRDINRQGSWLDFLKIQVNLVNFISGTFGTAWDKYSKNGLTFGCLREKKGWNFDLETIFFKQKQDFGIFI